MRRHQRPVPADSRAAQAAGERIQKALARTGFGSRREIERLVAAGRVRVNGRPATLGHRVRPGDQVQIDGRPAMRIRADESLVRVLAYHKPVGEICSRRDAEGRRTVFSRLPRLRGERWVNIGRLDVNTSGLLLFTNHGELAHRLMHPRHAIDREYAVRVYGRVDEAMLQRLRTGVEIEGETWHFDDITPGAGERANRWYTCLVQRGRHHEVRRLWESQGVQVSRLMRVRFGNIMLPTDLRPGRHVEIGGALLEELMALVGLSGESAKRSRTRRG